LNFSFEKLRMFVKRNKKFEAQVNEFFKGLKTFR